MTAHLPHTLLRLGEDDVLYGAESAPGVPSWDYNHYVAEGRRLQARAVRAAAAGLFRRAVRGVRMPRG